jgi:NADH dehydrogenase
VIGRSAAVFDFGKRRIKGWFAWVLWAIVHVYLLIGFENRLLVSIQWVWRYLTYERGARLITSGAPMSLPKIGSPATQLRDATRAGAEGSPVQEPCGK